ncbi:DUF433 domain-containing protein [Lewinella sp. 4G2]|uniref:DUF433 domain-containing protein n=1 Tax=Lewinella sp. 4G2 TaxID=1803372 RepID=UPI0007B47079|nr:DUF433 domain-containing protein [Lewinella sp. 4G2]OAV45557.1 hypothetical protein A3850_014110 [Lewinella sp. 4G2]
MNYQERITIDPTVMHGKPTIRKMRFTVTQMLELIGGGMTFEEILEDYPFLEIEDILACVQFAAKATDSRSAFAFV